VHLSLETEDLLGFLSVVVRDLSAERLRDAPPLISGFLGDAEKFHTRKDGHTFTFPNSSVESSRGREKFIKKS